MHAVLKEGFEKQGQIILHLSNRTVDVTYIFITNQRNLDISIHHFSQRDIHVAIVKNVNFNLVCITLERKIPVTPARSCLDRDAHLVMTFLQVLLDFRKHNRGHLISSLLSRFTFNPHFLCFAHFVTSEITQYVVIKVLSFSAFY